MKCPQCDHDAVKIKKGHFCPNCGKRVLNEKKSTPSNIPTAATKPEASITAESIVLPQVESKPAYILDLKNTHKVNNNIVESPKVSVATKIPEPAKAELPKEVIPENIKGIIEKHTETKVEPEVVREVINPASSPVLNIPNLAEDNLKEKPISGVGNPAVSQVKPPENIFTQKEDKEFWDKPIVRKNMVPTNKEKNLKKVLIIVIGLNVLVVAGIVYLLLT